MPTVKPTKPNITLPTAFGTSSSNVKTQFTPQELIDGYSASIPQVLDGGNLNYMIDALFQYLTWSNKYADWYASGPANTVPYINSSNQLDYATPVFGNANNTFTGNNTFSGSNTFTSSITSSGTNTFSGSNTFSNAVILGSNATVETPSSATDSSKKVVNTQWFRNALCSLGVQHLTKYEDISSVPYTAPIDGIMRVRIGATYNWELYINGVIVQQQNRNDSDSCTTTWATIPVKQGDVLTKGAGTIHAMAMYYPY